MKKYLFLTALLAFSLASCNKLVEKSSLYKNLKSDVDSLVTEAQLRNSELDEICKTIDGIVAGLDNIEKEERAVAQLSNEIAVDVSAKERADEGLKAIVLSVERYKQQISKLEKKLQSQPAQFRATINNLKKQLEEKDLALVALSNELGIKDATLDSIRIRLKNAELINDSLVQEVDKINNKVIEKQDVIDQQTLTINAAYYTIGKQSELKKSGVLDKKKVNPKINAKNFTRIDIYKNREIDLKSAKKVKLVSSHPTNSYTIEKNKLGINILKIKDPAAFWKQSRYLVIVTK